MDENSIKKWVHDLANQITPALAYLDALPAEYQAKNYDRALKSLKEVVLLIRQAQGGLGGGEINSVRMSPLLRDQFIISAAESHGILLEPVSPQCEGECLVQYAVNPDEFRRVLTNIWENSRAAGATRFLLETRCEPLGTDPCCLVSFLDNGRGMTKQKLNSLGVAYQGEDGLTHGQGVQIIRALCEKNGVSVVWYSLEHLGTKVTLRWPKVIPGHRRGVVGPGDRV